MGLFDSILGGGSEVKMPKLEDIEPMLQAQADINRIDRITPFGSLTYKTVGADTPLSFEMWKAQNPGPNSGLVRDQNVTRGNPFEDPRGNFLSGYSKYDAEDEYQKYLSTLNPGEQVATFNFSPELQSLFDTQFTPEAYQGYEQDYMDRYYDLVNPYRENRIDRFEQSMFDRGLPAGSEPYEDNYRPLGDEFSRADLMAAQQATGLADQRLMQDYNRLITAMGGSAIPVTPIDVMGPYNMAMNYEIADAQNEAANSIWNVLPGLAGAYMMGAPDDSWIWGK